jgi:uncharacterized membrane protein YidH (DUF202 family)
VSTDRAWDATAAEVPPRDPGLARERTQLAWNRSGVAVLVVVAILFRHLWPLEGARSIVALVLIGVGAGAWAVGMLLARRGRGAAGAPLDLAHGELLTIGTVVLATAGLLLAVFTT